MKLLNRLVTIYGNFMFLVGYVITWLFMQLAGKYVLRGCFSCFDSIETKDAASRLKREIRSRKE